MAITNRFIQVLIYNVTEHRPSVLCNRKEINSKKYKNTAVKHRQGEKNKNNFQEFVCELVHINWHVFIIKINC